MADEILLQGSTEAGEASPELSTTNAAAGQSVNAGQEQRLSAEAARRRVENRDLRDQLAAALQGINDVRGLLEQERQQRIAAQEAAAAAALDAARIAAATRHGLPAQLSSRLTGANAAEIEADAVALAELLGNSAGSTRTAGNTGNGSVAGNPNAIRVSPGAIAESAAPDLSSQILNKMRGGRSNRSPLFDPEMMAAKGGGLLE